MRGSLIGQQIRLQKDHSSIFDGVIYQDEKYDFSICNPPFFSTEEDRKLRKSSICQIQDSEDHTEGGEITFLQKMAQESVKYSSQVTWFTSLVGRKTTFNFIKTYLKEMLETGDLDIVTASTEILEGHTKRWVIGWKFIDSLSE
jgi:23S rRNA (adenine1618-N6)-methyltransferase